MRYEWDESKRTRNLSRHGFDFVDAPAVLTGTTLTFEDDRLDYGERRFITLGVLRRTVVSIVHTESAEVIRIISFRKATAREQAIYLEEVRY